MSTINPLVPWSPLYPTNTDIIEENFDNLNNGKAEDNEVVKLAWNQTIDWVKQFEKELALKHLTTPTNPASWYNKLYFKADWKLYYLNSAWVETEVWSWWWGWGWWNKTRRLLFPVGWVPNWPLVNCWPTFTVDQSHTISKCNIWYDTAWNGTVTVDVNKNWTTLFSTTKPTITGTNQTSLNTWTLTTTSCVSWDIFTMDIDSVSWTAGTTLYVELVLTA